jgi:hypothetical protein
MQITDVTQIERLLSQLVIQDTAETRPIETRPMDVTVSDLVVPWIQEQLSRERPIPDALKQKIQSQTFCLDLSNVASLVNASVAQLVGLSLVELSLSGQVLLTADALDSVAKISTLQKLSLSGIRNLGNSSLVKLTSLPLTDLDISKCEQVDTLTPLLQLTRLTTLDVSRCSRIKNATLSSLKTLPLDTLRIQTCLGLTSLCLDSFSGHPSLRMLDSAGNRHFKKENVEKFIQNNPNVSLIK